MDDQERCCWPSAKGGGHAIAAIILGGLTTLFNWGVILGAIVIGLVGTATK